MSKHYIKIKTKCHNYYKFMNKLTNLNIKVYDIKYKNNYLFFKVDVDTFKKLQKYLVSYEFIVIEDVGIYNIISKIKKYHVFVICFIISLFFLIIASNLIIEVNVIHENKKIRELILDELESVGIKRFAFKKSFKELQQIKENLLEKYPDKLDWLEFEIDGLVINVKVEERIITNINKNQDKCNIVASKEGQISNLKVLKGEALVRANDIVKEGDILISGIITYNNEEKMRVCAEGEVYAHTWYTVSVSIPLEYEVNKPTGKTKYNLVWQTKNNKYQIFKDRFLNYTKSYKSLLEFFDYKLLLERDMEESERKEKYSLKEAEAEGIKKAVTSLEKRLGQGNRIIDKKVLKKSLNDSKMDIDIFIVANEFIGKYQKIEDATSEGNDKSDLGNNQNYD